MTADGSSCPGRSLSTRCRSMVAFPTVYADSVVTGLTGAQCLVLHGPDWTFTLWTFTQPISWCQRRTNLQYSSASEPGIRDILQQRAHSDLGIQARGLPPTRDSGKAIIFQAKAKFFAQKTAAKKRIYIYIFCIY